MPALTRWVRMVLSIGDISTCRLFHLKKHLFEPKLGGTPTMLEKIRKALIEGDLAAINLVIELIGKTKIVDLTDEQVKVIVEILKKYA